MHRRLLVPDQDVLDVVLLEQRIVERKDGAAGIAENDLNALVDEGSEDDFGT
jgi:hypothetical protein